MCDCTCLIKVKVRDVIVIVLEEVSVRGIINASDKTSASVCVFYVTLVVCNREYAYLPICPIGKLTSIWVSMSTQTGSHLTQPHPLFTLTHCICSMYTDEANGCVDAHTRICPAQTLAFVVNGHVYR